MSVKSAPTGRDVFVNCPFSSEYRPIFDAIVFAVLDCGFRPRCALEADDAGEVRFAKICRIIKTSSFGIHDLSYMQLDPSSGLPRLNMAFELGLFLGARQFGERKTKQKVSLVLDEDSYRYQAAISDIAGQDIRAHGRDPRRAIVHIRDWLQANAEHDAIPGGSEIAERYDQFRRDLPDLCAELRLRESELTFVDLGKVMARWLRSRG